MGRIGKLREDKHLVLGVLCSQQVGKLGKLSVVCGLPLAYSLEDFQQGEGVGFKVLLELRAEVFRLKPSEAVAESLGVGPRTPGRRAL